MVFYKFADAEEDATEVTEVEEDVPLEDDEEDDDFVDEDDVDEDDDVIDAEPIPNGDTDD